jgi:phosphinothricin acetyltransferase
MQRTSPSIAWSSRSTTRSSAGFWTLQAGVFPENEASMALHVALGFRVVGVRERIGCMDGLWRDVVLLERRTAGQTGA